MGYIGMSTSCYEIRLASFISFFFLFFFKEQHNYFYKLTTSNGLGNNVITAASHRHLILLVLQYTVRVLIGYIIILGVIKLPIDSSFNLQ